MPPSPNITSTLNDDVLQEIFIICCTDVPNDLSTCFVVGDTTKSSIRNLPQLSVSRVCSSWRHVALLTPQLWNNINISEFTHTNLSIAREYLSRAGNLPVSIVFALFGLRETDEQDWRPQLTDFLSSYRLRTLTVLSTTSSFHLALPDLSKRSVADLESLMMLYYTEKGFIDLNDIRYPKLAVLHNCGVQKISGYSASLRIFDGTGISVTVAKSWDFLTRCPSLEEAKLRITRDGGTSRRPPLIQLQHLRSLCLHSDVVVGEIPFSTFIEALALPVIEELSVWPEGSNARVAWSSTTFQSLAYRSNCFPYLREISLSNPTSIVDTGALLASIPSLKSMRFYLYYSSVVFDHLVLNGLASGLLAPQLQSLAVGYISNEGEFLDMVESRTKNAQVSSDGTPAPFIKVKYSTYYCPDAARLRDMQQREIPIDARMHHF